MIAKPQVSCIIPACNAEAYLRVALESVLAQSANVAMEIIVVDDGSTDRTVAIASGFGDKVHIISQSNSGQAAARNRGSVASQGEFITFLDGDDLWHTEKIERQLAAFRQDPTLELCAAHVQNFRGDMELVGDPVPGYSTELLIRRSLFSRLGPFDSRLQHAVPLEWMLRARETKTVECLLPETLSYRRLHQQNMSHLQASESLKEHLHVLHALIKRSK
jgi:glycosyltransferase involved in cell wall biosynthesis